MLTYSDPYLGVYANEERELRALNDVNLLGTFSTEWTERLQVLRVYIIICTESLQSSDDIFSVKLKQYMTEFKNVLALAQADTATTTSTPQLLFSISMERA
jgi:hypothetical protein